MPSKDRVIALARSISLLSPDQIMKIESVVHFMSDADLKQLETMLLDLQKEELGVMEKELETVKEVGAAYEEFKADKARTSLASEEGTSRKEEAEAAESLIKEI